MYAIQLIVLPLMARALIVAAVVCALIAGIRWRRGMDARAAISRSLSEALIGLGVVLIWGVTLAPADVLVNGATPRPGPINIVPFLPLLAALGDVRAWRETLPDLVGNLLLFVPIGFGLRWRFGLGLLPIPLIARGASAVVEVSQAFSDQMRSADIDDVILNGLGAVAGAYVFLAAGRLVGRRIEDANFLVAGADHRPEP